MPQWLDDWFRSLEVLSWWEILLYSVFAAVLVQLCCLGPWGRGGEAAATAAGRLREAAGTAWGRRATLDLLGVGKWLTSKEARSDDTVAEPAAARGAATRSW